MAIEAASIVDRSIDAQLESAESQSVGEFVNGVEQEVKENVESLRVVFGDAVQDLAGDAMSEAQSYREAQLQLFDPDFKVKDTAAKGAAAWNEKGGDNSIAVGETAMERKKDEAYWGRVVLHEETHQQEQVAEYNVDSVVYPGGMVVVNPALTEWHAITQANQPSSDLTPDYQEHKRQGDALAAYLGSAEPIIRALRTGDMQSLQDAIHARSVQAAA